MCITLPTLEGLMAPVIDRLAVGVVLAAEDLPTLPPTLAAESVMATKSIMKYSGGFGVSSEMDYGAYYRADVLNFHSSRQGYRALAAAWVCVLLHRGEANVDIRFSNPNTQIKALHLQRAESGPDAAELALSPVSFAPRLDAGAAQDALFELDDSNKPRFLLTHKDEITEMREPWGARDHVWLATANTGLALLTSALIDYALHGTPERELALRAPPLFFATLGSCSAEARFWLPGSFADPDASV